MSSIAIREQPKYTALVACPNDFKLTHSNAAQTTRLGYVHGFGIIGVTGKLVKYQSLAREAELCDNPIFWLTHDCFEFLPWRAIKLFQKHPTIVLVNTWFDGMEKVHKNFDAPGPSMTPRVLHRIQTAEPDFVFCSAPEPYFNSYENWIEIAGFKLVSLPWACDLGRYYPCPGRDKFTGTEVAFVGGYRPYKEPQYEAYLWPYEDRLKVWGYSRWPRCYQGYLDNNEEKWLYQNSIVCPTISEPQFSVTGDTVERPFKILGSGGLTVFDCIPAYTHLFSPGEALIPDNPDLYRQMMDAVLNNPDLNRKYRLAGFKAVIERHTYAHRCRKIMKELGL